MKLCYNSNQKREIENMSCLFGFISENFAIMASDSINIVMNPVSKERLSTQKTDKIFCFDNTMVGVYGQTSFPDNTSTEEFLKGIDSSCDIKEKIKDFAEKHKEYSRLGFGFLIIEKQECFKLTHIYTEIIVTKQKIKSDEFTDLNSYRLYGYISHINEATVDNILKNPIETTKEIMELNINIDKLSSDETLMSKPIKICKMDINGEITTFKEA